MSARDERIAAIGKSFVGTLAEAMRLLDNGKYSRDEMLRSAMTGLHSDKMSAVRAMATAAALAAILIYDAEKTEQ